MTLFTVVGEESVPTSSVGSRGKALCYSHVLLHYGMRPVADKIRQTKHSASSRSTSAA